MPSIHDRQELEHPHRLRDQAVTMPAVRMGYASVPEADPAYLARGLATAQLRLSKAIA